MFNRLTLNNFTVFQSNSLEFSEGINVLIGKNATGKTHLLKLLAASLKAIETAHPSQEKAEQEIAERLLGYFKPEALGRLVRRAHGRNKAEVELTHDGHILAYSFATNSQSSVKISSQTQLEAFKEGESKALYLPTREIISIFEGFISLYMNREISFDESYYRLALALERPLLRGARFEEIQRLIKPLEEITNSKVIKENGRFYLNSKAGKMEMPLVAEGYRKIATLMYLIANGELAGKSILFWDEPEANLNPALIKQTVDILFELARKGVQIFVSSHDYLLTHLLSLKSEYRAALPEDAVPSIRFFGLYQTEQGTRVEAGETLADLSENTILDEFSKFYDMEQAHFNQALQSK